MLWGEVVLRIRMLLLKRCPTTKNKTALAFLNVDYKSTLKSLLRGTQKKRLSNNALGYDRFQGTDEFVQMSSAVFVHISVLLLFNQLLFLTPKGITEHLRMKPRGTVSPSGFFAPDPAPQGTPRNQAEVKSD